MFEWTVGTAYSMIVTVYPANFTLNNVAALKFKDCRYCMLGLNRDKSQVAIKIVTKEDIDLGLVPIENLHKVSYGKGYARISNKAFIKEIYDFMNIKDEQKALKFNASFDELNQMLIIDLESRG